MLDHGEGRLLIALLLGEESQPGWLASAVNIPNADYFVGFLRGKMANSNSPPQG